MAVGLADEVARSASPTEDSLLPRQAVKSALLRWLVKPVSNAGPAAAQAQLENNALADHPCSGPVTLGARSLRGSQRRLPMRCQAAFAEGTNDEDDVSHQTATTADNLCFYPRGAKVGEGYTHKAVRSKTDSRSLRYTALKL